MKVVSTSPSFAKYSNEPIEILKKHQIEFEYLPADITEEDFIQHMQGVDAAIVAFNTISAKVLDSLPDLKIVCKHGVGVDNIDVKAAQDRGVIVTNVPNANKHAVADFAFALMLSLARKIPESNERTKKGEWPRIFGSDVYGKTLGIVGLGMIGREVARRAKGFDMQIVAYDPYPNDAFAQEYGIEYVELEDLLKLSDFITLHMPLTEQTRNLIDEKELSNMKKEAFLVNASRGGIVSEDALYTALKNNDIAGAALDVFENEPAYEHKLFELSNFIALPHIAGYTSGAINTLGMVCVENIVDVLINNKTPNHVIKC
ncbi:phosphoglycerate dehydrogenase [Niallia nealsonii]|uniref:Hydroxyacid dehydrogenase n=1 Tax=Niallia nealsonii TaxID=115979 RepID=A0A2N0Z2K9_9BACI|nr:phosphoglycerate dehydrogenase [Niallia nealsonii]PKG23719.1 hydroxyacid dehydrogenase [Niallia nealsonii]